MLIGMHGVVKCVRRYKSLIIDSFFFGKLMLAQLLDIVYFLADADKAGGCVS